VQTLGDLRTELGFRIIGYVFVPEHCHLLIWPGPLANPSQIMQKLSERTANSILRNLRENLAFPWCRKMLKRFELPPTVHDHAHYRVWNRRGYDMNLWSEKKIREKLNCTHNDLVKRVWSRSPAARHGRVRDIITWRTRLSWRWTRCLEL
jgi:REP element-mobilizing transposase RayT